MNLNFVFLLLASTLYLLPTKSSAQSTDQQTAVTASSAHEFLESMGVVSSITGRGEMLEGTIRAMRYTGLRFIRCGIEDGIPVAAMNQLHQETGVKIAYGLLSGGTDLENLIATSRQLAKSGALLAIEGNNEPNNWGITYKGQTGGRDGSWLPVAMLQRDLYEAVKRDSLLKDFPVWSISESGAQTVPVGLQFLTIPTDAETLMPPETTYADYANCHNYITHPAWPGLHDNQTWLSASPGADCPVDGLFKNYGQTWLKHFKGYSESDLLNLPRVTTETGYPVGGEVTEELQARLFLNLYLSQFKRGWKHTSIYLLRTRSNEPQHESYALYKSDYSPKQAAHYLHHLTNILKDDAPSLSTESLAYFIPDQPETVHDLLLQKNEGTFFLVLWGERFRGGADTISVNFGVTQQAVTIYNPTVGSDPVARYGKSQSIELTLTNHPLILKLTD